MIEITAWQDAEIPFTLEYSRLAFERIRQRAVEALNALPRVGMGVGGLLLGEHTVAGIRIDGTLELPCSHTLGPTFQLTPDEIRQSLELVKSAAEQREVVGIYCTRTRGALVTGSTDRELFDLLCPEPWQIVFALRPASGEPTRAAVFFRKAGELEQGTVKELWEWRPVELDEPQEELPAPPEPRAMPAAAARTGVEAPVTNNHPPAALPANAIPSPSTPVVIPMPAPVPAVAPAAITEPVAAPAVIEMPRPVPAPPKMPAPFQPAAKTVLPVVDAPASAAPPPPRRTPVSPQFVPDPPRTFPPSQFGGTLFGQPIVHQPNKVPLRLLALAGGLVFLAVGAGMFATRDAWLPRPPLTLSCTDSNGMLEIRWNADAARGLDHGSLLINDGGGVQLDTVALDPLTMLSGSFLYKRKSDRVTVTLDLGNQRARTEFPPDVDGAGTAPVSAPGATGGATLPERTTTLPSPPPSGAISPYGNPVAPPPTAAPGTSPDAAPVTGTASAQDSTSARPAPRKSAKAAKR